MIELLKKGVAQLDDNHPWRQLTSWHLKQIIRQIRLRGKTAKLPPFSEIEIYQGQRRLLTILYIRLIRKDLRALVLFLKNCDIFRIRKLLWQRFTSSSTIDIQSFPPDDSALFPTNTSDQAQSLLNKRSQYCRHQYWKDQSQVFQVTDTIEYFIEEFTWWNTYIHPEHGSIYEIRDRTGHGLRWSLDTKQLVEAVEPNSDNISFYQTFSFVE